MAFERGPKLSKGSFWDHFGFCAETHGSGSDWNQAPSQLLGKPERSATTDKNDGNCVCHKTLPDTAPELPPPPPSHSTLEIWWWFARMKSLANTNPPPSFDNGGAGDALGI